MSMSAAEFGLALSVFLACAVEAVEALTIVLAVGTVRSWRSSLYGVGAAALVLAALIAALGPALSAIPIGALRVVVGGLLLVFGLQWLRKAILRAAGLKALHDELGNFAEETERARAVDSGTSARASLDGYAFTVSLKARPARGTRGGVHRAHLRRQPAPRGAGGDRRGAGRRCS